MAPLVRWCEQGARTNSHGLAKLVESSDTKMQGMQTIVSGQGRQRLLWYLRVWDVTRELKINVKIV